ncbi:MAG TPA: SpoIIE family protein phosphatase [Mycobacteriales bacterium]|nr:SpoIIE family protein phosphatase [Mycobacteriales bacterium]
MDPSGLEPYLTPELLEQLGDAVTVIDADWTYRYASARAAEIIGRPLDKIIGMPVWEIFPEVVGTPQYDACVRAMTERTRQDLIWFFDTVGRWYAQHAIPVGTGLLIVVDDVTEQQFAAHRSEQLVVVGEGLAGATTVEEVNAALVERVFPLLGAAGGSVVLADEERGLMRAVGWSGVRPGAASDWAEFRLDLPTPSTEAYRTGKPVYIADVEASRTRYPEIAAELVRMDRQTAAAIPLASAGVRLGALVVTFHQDRQITLGDEQFLDTVAAMTAQALMRARLIHAERQSIAALQRSLLPSVVPKISGISIAVRYVASDATTEVGGDWYDVIPLPAGAVGLVMGDVEGHDLGAAALMGLIRSAVRAYALEEHPPAIVLGRANAFLASLGLGRIVTLGYAQLHPVERLITTVSAGHPGIQVAARDGSAFEVPSDVGPPLGVFDSGLLWPETTSTLPAHATLAMFTDGLVETRRDNIGIGIGRVRQVLLDNHTTPPEELADLVLADRTSASHDDVALLIARLTAPAEASRRLTRRLPPTPASVFLARRFTAQLLEAWGLSDDVVRSAELVMSELVTNAARHSEEPIEVRLSCESQVLRMEVEDTSHRMPDVPTGVAVDGVDEEATGGRGLVLVDAISSRWGVVSAGLNKHVWAELDVPDLD